MTASQEEYLKTIYILINQNGKARVTDIADYLQYSKASVNRALKALTTLGVIDYESYGDIVLTKDGERKAIDILKRHNTLKAFLIQVLNVEPEIAEEEARKMKHSISEDTVKKFSKYISSIIQVDELNCAYNPENAKCQKCVILKTKDRFDKKK